MPRLRAELERLYACPAATHTADAAAPRTRALVLEFVQPVNVQALGALWQGVQNAGWREAEAGAAPADEPAWPAPAIAVNGHDAMQLWFSLARPLGMQEADALLHALCRRFLPDVPARALRRWVNLSALARSGSGAPAEAGDALGPSGALDALVCPVAEDRWQAFVAADLAPLLAETPWLDFPPNREGQAKLLTGLKSISPTALDDALKALAAWEAGASGAGPALQPVGEAASLAAPAQVATVAPSCPASLAQPFATPQQFLRAVMNEPAVPLAQRLEAAKALLAGAGGAPGLG